MLDADTSGLGVLMPVSQASHLNVEIRKALRRRREDTPALVKMDLTGCSGAFIMLSNGQEYQVDRVPALVFDVPR